MRHYSTFQHYSSVHSCLSRSLKSVQSTIERLHNDMRALYIYKIGRFALDGPGHGRGEEPPSPGILVAARVLLLTFRKLRLESNRNDFLCIETLEQCMILNAKTNLRKGVTPVSR